MREGDYRRDLSRSSYPGRSSSSQESRGERPCVCARESSKPQRATLICDERNERCMQIHQTQHSLSKTHLDRTTSSTAAAVEAAQATSINRTLSSFPAVLLLRVDISRRCRTHLARLSPYPGIQSCAPPLGARERTPGCQ